MGVQAELPRPTNALSPTPCLDTYTQVAWSTCNAFAPPTGTGTCMREEACTNLDLRDIDPTELCHRHAYPDDSRCAHRKALGTTACQQKKGIFARHEDQSPPPEGPPSPRPLPVPATPTPKKHGGSSDDSNGAHGASTNKARGSKARERQRLRRVSKLTRQNKLKKDEPLTVQEYQESRAAKNKTGLSVFQLNATSLTQAVEELMLAFHDDVYHFQETHKDRLQTLALLKRLRCRGFQCAAAPAVIKESDLSCGVLSAARKTARAKFPCQNKEGITDDPRFLWSRHQIEGVAPTVLMANCYLHCGMGLKDRNVHYLNTISTATNHGRTPVFAFGDFNIPAETLRASGLLEALGLDIIVPADAQHTCTAGKGSTIDYVVCTKGWGQLVHSCEVVRNVPCGTHLGVRTTFVNNAADVIITTLRKPKPLEAAIAFAKARKKFDSNYTIPTWQQARECTQAAAQKHAQDNRLPQVDDYIRLLNIEEGSLQAAISYAKWSAAAEYRLLATCGIKVKEFTLAELEPFLGRGRLPVLVEMPLSELNETKTDRVDDMAWSLGVDDAYGHDRYAMTAAVLKQIFKRASTGKKPSHEELAVVRNCLTKSQHADQAGDFITRIALAVAPTDGDSPDDHAASRVEFATTHFTNLDDFYHERLTQEKLIAGTELLHGPTVMLQARHVQLVRQSMADWMTTSFDSGGGQVFRFLKGGREPDTMASAFFSSITTDPNEVLSEKFEEWRKTWKCTCPIKRQKAGRAIRAAIAEAQNASRHDPENSQVHSGDNIASAAGSFKSTTSIGGDNWPFKDLAKVQRADLDTLGRHLAKWRQECVQPMQFLLNTMSMIPKKDPGTVRMIASMASGWRLDVRLDAAQERAWVRQIADTDDAAKPGSSCLHAMETRQILLDMLKALDYDTVEGLWDFVKFYDTLDPYVLLGRLRHLEYGSTKTALTMMVHYAPRLLKLGQAYSQPTESMGRSIVAGCGRSGNLAKAYSHTALDNLRTWFKEILGGDNCIEGEPTDGDAPSAGTQFIGNAVNPSPVGPNCGLKSGTFVDDTTMLMWAKEAIEGNRSDLPKISYEVAKHWTDLVTNVLLLDTSEKNQFIPEGPAAAAALAGCQFNACTASVGPHGKDLGIDTVATGQRNDSVLHERAVAAGERADRHIFVINTMATSGVAPKYVRKAQNTARQALSPAQIYGNSAIGAAPRTHNKQKSNLAAATGVMGKGSSRTLAIEWTFGSDAQPDINNPLLVLKAWFRFLDSEQLSQIAITKAWHKGVPRHPPIHPTQKTPVGRCHLSHVRHSSPLDTAEDQAGQPVHLVSRRHRQHPRHPDTDGHG